MSPVLAHMPATPAATPQTAIVQKSKPAPHGWSVYVVRSGDTVRDIALRYGTTNAVIVSRNHLSHGGNRLRVGQRLQVPRTAAMARGTAAKAKAAHTRAVRARAAAIRRSTYVVRSGDTLGGIAVKRGVRLASLLKANHLRLTSMIHVGQRLRVPGGRVVTTHVRRAAAHGATRAYRVRSGDTLSVIAQRTGTPCRACWP